MGTLWDMGERSARIAGDPRPPLSKRITSSQWEAIDALIAIVLAATIVSLLATLSHGPHYLPVWAAALLGSGATLPLAVRRRRPLSVLAVVGAAVTIAGAIGLAFGPYPMIAMAVYTVATTYDRRRAAWALAVTEVALVTALIVAEFTVASRDTISPVVAAAAWFVGDAVRARRAYDAGLANQAAQRQREEVERARRSVVEERVRIARELHDVLAHSLSVIAIQAGVGRHVLESQPAEARQALAAVETTSRGALGELRRVVGLLRQGDHPSPDFAPAPGLGDLTQLIEQVRAAGVPVELDLQGEPPCLSQGIELSLYRIVQEALTNVVKHAGPARAHVAISFASDTVEVEIVDDGRGATSGAGDGEAARSDRLVPTTRPIEEVSSQAALHHGIIGMRERVALFSGSLAVGAGPEGGFRVVARLPLEPDGAQR